MAFKNSCFHFFVTFIAVVFCASTLGNRSRSGTAALLTSITGFNDTPAAVEPRTEQLSGWSPGGEWVLLHASVGVSAMHMQLMPDNKVVMFDRTDFGASNLSLPDGKCRDNDEVIDRDCTAHSLLYDITSNTYRALMVQTNVWCSSGGLDPNGTLVQTGGYHGGDRRIRTFTPCNDDLCDWVELDQNLTIQRWYSSDHILPDGRIIIVGGRRAFSYEFFPKSPNTTNLAYQLRFLVETSDLKEENNLYPFLYLLPDGNLYIFANQRSIVLDYQNDRVLREFPPIPGEKRSYPATGSSVMLPLRLTGGAASPEVEILICGGNKGGAYLKAEKMHVYEPASRTCGRMKITDPFPIWVMENMPMGRVMSDMLLLPVGDVIILNGAAKGTAGWEYGEDPVLNPILYKPRESDPSKRFSVLAPTGIPRMYHSSAILLPDGRILVGGSNPHTKYNFTTERYPTELSLESYAPPYLSPIYAYLRPSILSIESGGGGNSVTYGEKFSVTFTMAMLNSSGGGGIAVTMIPPSFTTHSFSMNQRMLVLHTVSLQRLSVFAYKVTVEAPATRNVAPPGYYMVFLVHQSVPGHSVWIRIHS
ncbi:PREDICTED: aldehyde oxidase GLOX [Ipomoea nil]|uniref:aldehyde oxidase GLOX n=1 Tax=Ipomoea nil TaxID=35883 RepID=UPI000901DFDC|nr:PREDICTED: aldehyde oxidase GLOX [Ipomoea nil]